MKGRTVSPDVPPMWVIALTWSDLLRFLQKLSTIEVEAGTWLSSWYRDPVHNAGVSRYSTSAHIAGLAIDLVVPSDQGRADLVMRSRWAGLGALDEGDHVHLQLLPVGETARRYPGLYG